MCTADSPANAPISTWRVVTGFKRLGTSLAHEGSLRAITPESTSGRVIAKAAVQAGVLDARTAHFARLTTGAFETWQTVAGEVAQQVPARSAVQARFRSTVVNVRLAILPGPSRLAITRIVAILQLKWKMY